MSEESKSGMTVAKPQKKSRSKFMAFNSAIGIIRSVIAFPVEHPLDTVKTRWQSKPNLSHEVQVLRDLISDKGVRGLYAGSLPNLARNLVKNAYRFPLMVSLPAYFSQNLPERIRKNKFLTTQLSSTTIAIIEAGILCPLERLKVLFMTQTQSEKISYRAFLMNNRRSLFSELYRGYIALWVRQQISWTVFLQADMIAKSSMRKYYKIPDDKTLNNFQLVAWVIFVAVTNVMCVMPLDVAKTFLQKAHPSTKYLEAYRIIYRKGGILGLFTGFRPRLASMLLTSFIGVFFMEKMKLYAQRTFAKKD